LARGRRWNAEPDIGNCANAFRFDLHGHAVIADTSIGIALAPSDGTNPNDLLKNADMARSIAPGG